MTHEMKPFALVTKRHGEDTYYSDGDPYRAIRRAYGINEEDVARLRALGVEPEMRQRIDEMVGRFAVVHRPSGWETEITPVLTRGNLHGAVARMFAQGVNVALTWEAAWALVPGPACWWHE